MLAPDAYCREIEAHLCRKNDGHLIRIVGPAFERVTSWAAQGVPLNVAFAGIDRYFERYYRKGPRRRPVRVEFCEADVLDAFDEWRRAVGVSIVAGDAQGGPLVEEPVAAARSRRSLKAHIESVLARLTVLRGSDRLRDLADEARSRSCGRWWMIAQAIRVSARLRVANRGELMWTDVRHAVRSLVAARWFAVGAALTFMLGIGVNLAVFAAIDRLLFRSLPYGAPEELVSLRIVNLLRLIGRG